MQTLTIKAMTVLTSNLLNISPVTLQYDLSADKQRLLFSVQQRSMQITKRTLCMHEHIAPGAPLHFFIIKCLEMRLVRRPDTCV